MRRAVGEAALAWLSYVVKHPTLDNEADAERIIETLLDFEVYNTINYTYWSTFREIEW